MTERRLILIISIVTVSVVAAPLGVYVSLVARSARPDVSPAVLGADDDIVLPAHDGLTWRRDNSEPVKYDVTTGGEAFSVQWRAGDAVLNHVVVRYDNAVLADLYYLSLRHGFKSDNPQQGSAPIAFKADGSDRSTTVCDGGDCPDCQSWRYMSRYGQYVKIVTYFGEDGSSHLDFLNFVRIMNDVLARALKSS